MKIKYFAWLKKYTKKDEELINDSSIIDVNSLKKFISKKYPSLKRYIENEDTIRIAINLKYVSKNKKISKNDEIALFPPVSGG